MQTPPKSRRRTFPSCLILEYIDRASLIQLAAGIQYLSSWVWELSVVPTPPHVFWGIWILVLCLLSKCFNHWAISQGPWHFLKDNSADLFCCNKVFLMGHKTCWQVTLFIVDMQWGHHCGVFNRMLRTSNVLLTVKFLSWTWPSVNACHTLQHPRVAVVLSKGFAPKA